MMDPRRLTVYRNGRPVGTLWADGTRLQFAYHTAVLGDRGAAVSVLLPVRAGTFGDHEARPCFENLLPEGDLRAYLAKTEKLDEGDVVGLLAVFGGECAGALSLWPEAELPPPKPEYAYFGPSRSPVSDDVDHLFRSMSITHFGRRRSPVSVHGDHRVS
jgi:serine/threonine-protein kinase HipA